MGGRKIVLAEDEEHLGNLVKFKLSRAGYDVIWKMDGREVLAAIRAEKPELVLLDVMMPGLTGFEVLEQMKQDAALKEIPVILLTARSQKNDVLRGVDLGAADYVTKPFRPAELLARVNRLLGVSADETPAG